MYKERMEQVQQKDIRNKRRYLKTKLGSTKLHHAGYY